ncbi:RimK/LysX family protein [Candidatus Saccharibacteria bacterium]|nr:RimK/LysX family protein [Candidatus Saccharibacteria bacterium]
MYKKARELLIMTEKQKIVLGELEYVDFLTLPYKSVPAKIDTGAKASSVWASKITMTEDGELRFVLFGEGSPFYTGKIIKRRDYRVAIVRNSTGLEQIRYQTNLKIRLKGQTIDTPFNLSDRSRNNFPILIGNQTISGRFVVDVSQAAMKHPKHDKKTSNETSLNDELAKNPYEFHQKYKKIGE